METPGKCMGTCIFAMHFMGLLLSFIGLISFISFIIPSEAGPPADLKIISAIGFALLICLGIISIVIARGVRLNRSWSKQAGIVLAVIYLLIFPLGTLFGALILIALLDKQRA